jgi:hypothetical protein
MAPALKSTHAQQQRDAAGAKEASGANLKQVRARLVVRLLHHQAGCAEENFDLVKARQRSRTKNKKRALKSLDGGGEVRCTL